MSRMISPFAGTDGDARRAFNHIVAHWDTLPMEGISKEAFADKLGREIVSEQDAERVVGDLIPIAGHRFAFVSSAVQHHKGLVFVSYSHQDSMWLDKLRMMLKPLERKGNISVWTDKDIEAGDQWREKIHAAIQAARVAVFLVSPAFLSSDFVNKQELPELLKAATENRVRIIWIYISACLYEETGLSRYQAAHDISTEEKLRKEMQGKSPVVSIILSFLIPGLGDLYCGNWMKALIFFALDLLCFILVFAVGIGAFL